MEKVLVIIVNIFERAFGPKHPKHHHKHRATGFNICFGLAHSKKEQSPMPAEITLTNEQQVVATLKPVTSTGKPAKLDGAPKWSVVSGDGTVTPSDDGLSATLVTPDLPGDTTYMVDADADLGSGVEDLQDVIVVHTTGANAKNLGISLGNPTSKP